MARQQPADHLPAAVLTRADFAAACAEHDLGTVLALAKQWGGPGFTASHLARRCDLTVARVQDYVHGRRQAQSIDVFARVCDGLRIPGAMFNLAARPWENPTAHESSASDSSSSEPADEETEAWELARIASASDLGAETLIRISGAIEKLCLDYSRTSPEELLRRTRRYLRYVHSMLELRSTLAERRELVNMGGWLSLLAATSLIDLKRHREARAGLRTALSMAVHGEHPELQAWCHETAAWQYLTTGDYGRATELARIAVDLAPNGSSVHIQATAQIGRAASRVGNRRDAYEALASVEKLVSGMREPGRPEHHYRYDPNKAISYAATTLSWIGDPAAETAAREVLARLCPADGTTQWPRRVALANIDLALVLAKIGRLDEARGAALQAFSSGKVAPSSDWRASEVVRVVEAQQARHATELRDAYAELHSRNE